MKRWWTLFGFWLLPLGALAQNFEVWGINYWVIDQFFPGFIRSWNERNPNAQARLVQFENDPYKQRLFVALGAKSGPDVFYNWGGGVLESYVRGGAVEDLTQSIDSAWRNRFIELMWRGVTFNGRIYGVPATELQPVVWFYNKEVFRRLNLQLPQTWGQLLTTVDRLKAAGVVPIVAAGGSKWPLLMYQEYLVDRIGGPEVFEAIVANRPGAWKHPAVLRSAELIAELSAKAPFQPGWESAQYGTGTVRALFATGRAAMQLMGVWEFGALVTEHPDFVNGGQLGWFAFPRVEGGRGDPRNLAGNFTNYFSVASFARNKPAAIRFLRELSFSDDYVRFLLKNGAIPPTRGIAELIRREGAYPEWQGFVYGLVERAPYYVLSWDQAMPPQLAQPYLDNLQLLFLRRITPQEFVDRMQALADGLRR